MRKFIMSKDLNKARQKLIDLYIKSLSENTIPWEKGWNCKHQVNAISKTNYHGVNSLLLSYIQSTNFKDNRWCTFNQAREKGWTIQKGATGVPIEFWSIYDKEKKRTITNEAYNSYIKSNPEKENNFIWLSRCYYVFNADQVDGIQEQELSKNVEKINTSYFIENVIRNLKVKYEEKGSEAYYNSSLDRVVIPEAKSFKNEYEYHATQLHELCHATGHSTRLNRNISNSFGTEEYAKEELRAEIGSSFLMQNLELEFNEIHVNNHKAYIQNWISILDKDPNELFRAIADASKIESFILKYGSKEIERETVLNNASESNVKSLKERITTAIIKKDKDITNRTKNIEIQKEK